MFIRKKVNVIGFMLSFLITSSCANFAKSDTLRTAGDTFRHLNPIVTALFATQEKGLGHFAFIYAQSMSTVLISRNYISKTKWKACKRPYKEGRLKTNYKGLISGHTMAAWSSAAYARIFFDEYEWVAIPLYATAAVTGYSRYHNKCHTGWQVATAVILAEGIVYLNKAIGWTDCYSGFDIQVGSDECLINFKIKL